MVRLNEEDLRLVGQPLLKPNQMEPKAALGHLSLSLSLSAVAVWVICLTVLYDFGDVMALVCLQVAIFYTAVC